MTKIVKIKKQLEKYDELDANIIALRKISVPGGGADFIGSVSRGGIQFIFIEDRAFKIIKKDIKKTINKHIDRLTKERDALKV